VRSNATATPLVRDVPIACDIDDLKMGGWDTEEVRSLFNFLEFRTLWDRLLEATNQAAAVDRAEPAQGAAFEVVVEPASAASLTELCQADSAVGVEAAWEGEPGRSAILGLAFAATPEQAQWLPVEQFADDKVHEALCRLFGHVSVHAHRAKELMRGLAVLGIDITSLGIDTAVAAYLVDPADSLYLLEDLCPRYAGIEVRSPDAPPAGQLDLSGTATEVSEEAARRASAVLQLTEPLAAALDARGLRTLYDSIERPLVRVLARMEAVGVRVDGEYLRGLIKSLTDEVRQLEGEIQDLAGHPFTVNSTKQLRTVLYDELGLAPQKKTKTGFSTDAQSLEKLKGLHPIVDKLLRYREVEKLRSTYGEGLLSEIGPDGRIHATFQQTVARTGRLSSDRPNLHNIPIRTEEGRQFRRAFLPEEGWKLLIADYNQIELRVIAHLAEDPGLVEAFRSGQDIHEATASRVFGVEPGEVTLGQRSKAKMVSYGLAYGMESYGLAQRLNIPVDEAAAILKAYFEAFPNVKAYMERTVEEARQRGYTETLFGRRRQIPELSSSNFRIRQAGERQAMNAGIQGLAADIFKVALVRLDGALESEGLDARLVLQVHDEVILEVPPAEEARASELTLEAMRGAVDLRVPMEVNLSWGENWAEAKG
jgi:DNA polymerase-1